MKAMRARIGKPVEHRARCKRCGKFPEYFTNVVGSVYHVPLSTGTVGFAHKSIQDYHLRKWQGSKQYFHENWLRSNSIRGPVSTSSFYFKKYKNKWSGYRILLSCKCGLNTWMFPVDFDEVKVHKEMHLDVNKYAHRSYLEDPNLGKF